jgi:hypothetical protein
MSLIVLTISPFLVIDDNPIRAYKRYEIKAEEIQAMDVGASP